MLTHNLAVVELVFDYWKSLNLAHVPNYQQDSWYPLLNGRISSSIAEQFHQTLNAWDVIPHQQ
jgi:hypothetical protein